MDNLKYILAIAVGAFSAGLSALIFIDERIDKKLDVYLSNAEAQNIYVKKSDLIEPEPSWPEGKYVILSNGSCPKGFVAENGGLGAITFHQNTGKYLRSVTFGDSSIGIHANGNSGALADINISACVKH